MKGREVKCKVKKQRYTHLNAEFQKKARRGKTDFLSKQCKEIEENNRMGKTRDLFKKIRDTKGTFHAKMCVHEGQNKGQNLGQKWYAPNRSRRYQEEMARIHRKTIQQRC